jgi:hypothetical protein
MKNLGNISEPELYEHCYIGTKNLIEAYHNEIVMCIKAIYQARPTKISDQTKLKFFAETRHSYGHSAILLSGGGTFGKFHSGFLKALYE